MLWWLITQNSLMLTTNVSFLFLFYLNNHRLFRYAPGVFFSWRLGWRRISIWYILLAEGKKQNKTIKEKTHKKYKTVDENLWFFKKPLLLSSIFHAFPNALIQCFKNIQISLRGQCIPPKRDAGYHVVLNWNKCFYRK